jgi:hypothetical protein
MVNGEGNCSGRGWLTRAPPTHPLNERVEDDEEEPVIESVALCGEGRSVLRMLRAIDCDHDHLPEKTTRNSFI